jgi:hypothetical protein
MLKGDLIQSFVLSINILQVSSFVGNMMIGDPQGEVLG